MSEQDFHDEYAEYLEQKSQFVGQTVDNVTLEVAIDKCLGIELLPPIRLKIDDVEILQCAASMNKIILQAQVRAILEKFCDDIRAEDHF